ncbi:MAG TPA: hypothetical protein PKD83_00890 [Ignavibacteria bacterium]|nr:hypothetical protein [Ignavibacteria bacterium]
MSDEEKNIELIEKLKNLPRIKAGDDFMFKLESRIAEYESERNHLSESVNKKEQPTFFQRLFGQKRNQWLVPAMGLTVITVFAVYITKFSNNQIDEKAELNGRTNIENKTSENNSAENRNDNTPKTDTEKLSIENDSKKNESENLKEKVTATDQNAEEYKNSPESEISKKTKDKREEVSQAPPLAKSLNEEMPKNDAAFSKEGEESNVESYDGRSGMERSEMERSGILSKEGESKSKTNRSADEDMKEFDKPVEKSIMTKLNKINRQKLDSLQKKINKPQN